MIVGVVGAAVKVIGAQEMAPETQSQEGAVAGVNPAASEISILPVPSGEQLPVKVTGVPRVMVPIGLKLK